MDPLLLLYVNLNYLFSYYDPFRDFLIQRVLVLNGA